MARTDNQLTNSETLAVQTLDLLADSAANQSLAKVNGSIVNRTFSGTGALVFTDLTDVPSSYSGQGGKVVRVNAGASALEFFNLSGGGDALTSNPLSQFAATTSSQLAGVISDETGSGALVFATSPTFTTPVLGVATATSINKVAITAPATSATLTIADGKTLTTSNTITLTATDGSTLAIGAGGTLGSAAYTASSAYEVPLTFSTGLTRSTNTITVNTTQNIAKLSNLTSNGFVKTSGGDGTLSVDTNTYLTSLTGAVLTDQTVGQTIGATGARLTKLWATDITVTNAIAGSVTGNAATVTTNANLTGPITSVGNATSIAAQTGTGTTFVMNTSPTLVTPVLGAATGTSLQLSGLTASEMVITDASKNLVSAAVATYPSLAEIAYVKGVTSAIQTQINAKAPSTSPTFATSITGSYLTASEMLITDGSKNIVSAAVATYPSLTELTYVKGVTSALQTQLNNKQPLDADLTTIAGLTATSDNFLQAKSSAWASRTPTQVTADLIAFVGDSGSGGTKGLVPAPTTGDATKFLKGDGTWGTVSGGGTPGGSDAQLQYNNGGSFGGMANTSYSDAAGGNLSLAPVSAAAVGNGGGLYLNGAAGGATSGNGGLAGISAGDATNGDGGILYLESGIGSGTNGHIELLSWTGTYKFSNSGNSFDAILDANSIATSSKTFTFPNTTGTLALSTGSLTQFVGNTAWRVFYSDASGDIIELALGADGTFLKSNGASAAPTFATPAGSGDVSKVGTPVNNQIGVWTGDGTLEGDAALTFDTSTDTLATVLITATTVTANLTGNVTGNVSGTAATVTTASQPAITSLGTLTTLTVDDITINGNTISSAGASTLAITPTAGQAITFDGTITLDAGVIAGATSITSTSFVGALTGNASTATLAATATALANARTIGGVSFDGTANITVATATGGFTVSGGNLALGTNSITMSGSIGVTGTRVTKGWFTDLEVTNAIVGSITGNAATVTTNANLTGAVTSSGNATSLGSFTTSQLNTALSDNDVATLAGTEELTNKTLTASVGKGTWTASGTWTLPAFTMGGDIQMSENTNILLDAALSVDGKWCGISEAGTLGETVAFGQPCYFKAADSKWYLTDASAIATAGNVKIAMCVDGGAANDATTMLLWGKVRADSVFPTLTISAQVFLSETAGEITNTYPTTTDSVIRVVGFGNTADELFFAPSGDFLTYV